MGFGDLFIAATLGALLASDRRLQLRGAALAAVICPAFDLLFFFVDQTPATVPIALTLAALELSPALALELRKAIRPATKAEDIVIEPKTMRLLNRFDPIAHPVQAFVDLLRSASSHLELNFSSTRSKRSSIRFPNSSRRSSVQLSLTMV